MEGFRVFVRESMTHKTCATCEWFEPMFERTVSRPDIPLGARDIGGCLRFPPSFIGPHGLYACWPSVAKVDRCGEWTPRTSQPEEAEPTETGSRDAVKMDPQANDKSGHIDGKGRAAAEFLSQARAALSNVKVHDFEAYQEAVLWLASGTWNPTIRSIGEFAGALGYRPELVLHKVEPSER